MHQMKIVARKKKESFRSNQEKYIKNVIMAIRIAEFINKIFKEN